MPHRAAGWRIDPPVSEPSASGARPAATAAADPPLDPPGVRSSAQGFLAGPNAEFSFEEPIANSSQLVLPTITAPAAFEPRDDGGVVRRDVGLEDARRGGRPQSFVQRLSLIATGTPASGASRQRSGSRSMAAARSSARSDATVLKACSAGSRASMCASASRHTSAALRAPERTASRTSAIPPIIRAPAAL